MKGPDVLLILGSGGREHALSLKLSQSRNVSKIFVSPGNAGTSSVQKVSNVGELQDFHKFGKKKLLLFAMRDTSRDNLLQSLFVEIFFP